MPKRILRQAHTSTGSHFDRLSMTKHTQKQKAIQKIEWPAIYVNKNKLLHIRALQSFAPHHLSVSANGCHAEPVFFS